MKIKFKIFVALLCLIMSSARAADYYVSPSGNDSQSGSISNPFKTFAKAVSVIQAGDYIYLRGGTYSMGNTFMIDRSKNGSASAMISVFAYEGETPILQFDDIENSSSRGIVQDAYYWHWKGIIIEKAGDNGMLLSGNHCIIEECVFRYNHDTGLQLSRYNTSANSISEWPSHNLILNCESHDNADSGNEDADGFAAKLTSGEGNIFRGCVAHHNIDDGWDLYTKSSTGPIGIVTFENCIAHHNGTLSDGSTSGGGDKNGYKLGSSAHNINHIVKNCIAFNNGKHGFTDNGNVGSIKFYNNTSYNNQDYNYHTRDNATHIWRNNITLNGAHTDRIRGNAPESCNALDDTNSSWNWTISASSSDFQTMTPGPDKDPISNGFLHLAAGSKLIDAGCTDTGLGYNGSAPDLGAIEYGGEVNPPSSYQLTTTISGAGSVSPSSGTFDANSVINLQATASEGWVFASWSGDISGTSNPISLNMNSNKSVTAIFEEEGDNGGGTTPGELGSNLAITGSGAGADGSSKASGTSYGNSRDGDLTSYWQPGSSSNERISIKWSGSVSCNTVIIKEIGDVVGSWQLKNHDTDEILNSGSGLGSSKVITFSEVNLSKINLEILSASSAPKIAEFEVYLADGTVSPLTYKLTTSISGQGNLSLEGGNYEEGTSLSIEATAAEGYQFSHWGGDASGSENPLQITMDSDKNITANFEESAIAEYNVQVNIQGQGSVNPPSGSYAEGSSLSISASPEQGWKFNGWSGDINSSNNPLQITVDGHKNITANFIEQTTSVDLGDNLAISGPSPGADGSSKGNGSSYGNVRDGNLSTSWEPSGTNNERISVKWGSKVTCNTVIIKEIGDVVGNWSIVNHDNGNTLATGNGLGTEKLISFEEVSLSKINLVITDANSAPKIAEFEVYYATGTDNPAEDYYNLNVSTNGNGSVNPGSGSYAAGSIVEITASPSNGYIFTGWSGDVSSASNPLSLTMDNHKTVVANFSQEGGTNPPSTDGPVGYAAMNGGTTGGQGGLSYTCNTGDCILDLIYQKRKGIITEPITIYVNGTITPSNTTSASKIDIKEVRDVSIIGVGTSGEFNGIGIKIVKSGNIIVQNVIVHHVNIGDKDAISIEGPTDHIWIDHCELYAEYQGVDKDYYDGLLDAKSDSEYITYSYNYLHDSWKMMLVGSSSSDSHDRKLTMHHNLFENVNSRMPLFRHGNGHIFNNYYLGVVSTGINSRMGACLKVENNYFKNSHNPIVSAYTSTLGKTEEIGNSFDNVSWDLSRDDVYEPLSCVANIPYPYSNALISSAEVPQYVLANAGVGKIAQNQRIFGEQANLPQLLVYPNPTSEFLYYELENDQLQSGQLRILDLGGREYLKMDGLLENRIYVGDLSPGTYIIQLRTSGYTNFKVFIKK
ncbi:InlB B-repeat-containing protein [Persicobacter diffluens]|uniref:Pectate lyase domain-containing protein n=1 Tax=Persicobacter diffluens TaxID=981 RepID=A0AAN5ALQ2_9BACT|nr:hypothetical protein PEDI_47770 [Persicobacter diffluens]